MIDQQDRKFARNLGLPFKTPEMLFFGHEDVEFQWGSIDPSTIPKCTRVRPHSSRPGARTHAIVSSLPNHSLTHSRQAVRGRGHVRFAGDDPLRRFPCRTHALLTLHARTRRTALS